MTDPDPKASVEVSHLAMRFDANQVLDDVSLSVAPGEIVAIMGSSGGGKTTMLRCISGLLTPTSGRITVAGIDALKEPEQARKALGMVFQSAALFDYLNVHDNVSFGLKRWSKESQAAQEAKITRVLDLVGLEGTERLLPSELSGGMRKRVGIARALVLEPKVMLYDEPATGLDPITTYTIDKLIADVRRQLGMTTLIVSHDLSSVFRTADRIAFLHQGKLTFIGEPGEFRASRDEAIRELVEKSEANTFVAN